MKANLEGQFTAKILQVQIHSHLVTALNIHQPVQIQLYWFPFYGCDITL